jgi:hypothetical protein
VLTTIDDVEAGHRQHLQRRKRRKVRGQHSCST